MQPALLLHLPLTYFLLQQIDDNIPVAAANPVAAAAEKRKADAEAAAAVAPEAGGLQIFKEPGAEPGATQQEIDQAAAAAQAAAAGGGGSSGGSSSGAGGPSGGASGSVPVAHEQVCHFSRL